MREQGLACVLLVNSLPITHHLVTHYLVTHHLVTHSLRKEVGAIRMILLFVHHLLPNVGKLRCNALRLTFKAP